MELESSPSPSSVQSQRAWIPDLKAMEELFAKTAGSALILAYSASKAATAEVAYTKGPTMSYQLSSIHTWQTSNVRPS